MRKCITPATVSVAVGSVAALILFGISKANGDADTLLASEYLATFANLAAQNTVAALTTVGGVTTALFYTLIAKPIASIHEKCCKIEDVAVESNEPPSLYTRI